MMLSVCIMPDMATPLFMSAQTYLGNQLRTR